MLCSFSSSVKAKTISWEEQPTASYAPGWDNIVGNNNAETWITYSRTGVYVGDFVEPWNGGEVGYGATYHAICQNGSWAPFASGTCHPEREQTCCISKEWVTATCGGTGTPPSPIFDCSYWHCTGYTTCTRPAISAVPGDVSVMNNTCDANDTQKFTKAHASPGNRSRFCYSSTNDGDGVDYENHSANPEIMGDFPHSPTADDMLSMAPYGDGFLECGLSYNSQYKEPYWISRTDDGASTGNRYLMIPTKMEDYQSFLQRSGVIYKERACSRARITANCQGQPPCCVDVM